MPDKYEVRISREASADLETIHAYIERQSPQNAATVVARILDDIESLALLPRRYKVHRQSSSLGFAVHTMPVPPYVVYYCVMDQPRAVQILSVRHGARRRPRSFRKGGVVRPSRTCIFVVGISILACGTFPAAGAAIPPDRIDAAIASAKRYLYSQQQPDGQWEPGPIRIGTDHDWKDMQGDSFGGYTALCTYALLASGESPNNPRIRSAVEFLKRADIVGTYAIAMRCQVWLLVPHSSDEMKALIRKDASFLIQGMNSGTENADNKGLWDYLGKGKRVDHSVSQYGVLGLWACQQTGAIQISNDRWKIIEDAWRRDQLPDGGWNYGTMVTVPTPSMTAAGVATLFITQDYLHTEEGIACSGNIANTWIDRGIAWLDKNYTTIGDLDTYTMYGVERIGAASGLRFIAGHDWYGDFTAQLMKRQDNDGSWETVAYPGAQKLDSTAFALLFLARGREPVLMNKLRYRTATSVTTQPVEGNWNERPRDVANLAKFVGHQTEHFFNWQIVTLESDPADLHEAPILYLSGNEEIQFSDAQKSVIRRFIEQGGMVLANADCGQELFAKAFQELGRSLFPYDFRQIPSGHPIFKHQQFNASRWRSEPRLLGMTNGVRELMILIPDSDAARWWQLPRAEGHEEMFELGTDLFQYSNDRTLRKRGVNYWVQPATDRKSARAVGVARLQLGDNPDPEPGGWQRLAAILHNEDGIDLKVFKASPGQGALAGTPVAHLTGTTDFRLNDAARLELTTFVKNGGTLVLDAAGGSTEFADAAERELKALFGAAAQQGLAQPLARTHAVFNVPGHAIHDFTYRTWTRLRTTGNLKEPRLRGIQVGNRAAVFYSREDLTAGLVGEPVDGIVGYSPETATAIMRNIILYAAPQPTTQPK